MRRNTAGWIAAATTVGFSAAFLLAGAAWAASPAHAGCSMLGWPQVTLYSEDFDDGSADGWQPVAGDWNVANGHYHQTIDEDLPHGPDHISFYSSESFDDFCLEADMSTTTDTVPGGYHVGLIYRYTDENNYYKILYHPNFSGGAFRAEKVANGIRTYLVDNTPFGSPTNAPANFAILAEGTSFEAYFNSEPIVSWSDDSFLQGNVGLVSWDTAASFDNVSVSSPAPALEELLQRIEDLEEELANHTHTYRTGEGDGHNNIEARTSPATSPE